MDMPAQPADAPAVTDWPAYGRSNAAQRYSPLTAINRDNVDGLERAWTYRTGDLPERRWGAETTPLKIGDTLYLRSEEHTSELQSLMRISYAVFCLKKKTKTNINTQYRSIDTSKTDY